MATYKTIDLKDERGDDVRLWRCSDCWSVVGPLTRSKLEHTAWHDRIDALESRLDELDELAPLAYLPSSLRIVTRVTPDPRQLGLGHAQLGGAADHGAQPGHGLILGGPGPGPGAAYGPYHRPRPRPAPQVYARP